MLQPYYTMQVHTETQMIQCVDVWHRPSIVDETPGSETYNNSNITTTQQQTNTYNTHKHTNN